MNELKNYYEVLEIPSNARLEEIYHSYQRAKAAYSSDSLALYSLMRPEECRNILDLVEEAYSILSDPLKRKRYDEARGINREFNEHTYNNLSNRVPSARENIFATSNASGTGSSSHSTTYSQREEFASSPQVSSPMISSDTSARAPFSAASASTNVTKLVTQKRFALDYVINPTFEKEIEDNTEFSGDYLRKIREYKSVDLDRLSDMTKVSRLYLQAIESEDYDKLPAPVYVRGFVFQYAKCLKLKPETVANAYVARMKKLKPS